MRRVARKIWNYCRTHKKKVALGVVTLGASGCTAYYIVIHRRLRSLLIDIPTPKRRTSEFQTSSLSLVNAYDNEDLPSIGFVLWRCWLLAIRSFRVLVALLLSRVLHLVSTEVSDRMVVNFMVSMGPTYVKLGQWAATRPDLFPKSLCDALSNLYDCVPPHEWKHTKKALERGGILQYLTHVEEKCLNSGSIAQVHRATLKDDYIAVEHDFAPPTLATLVERIETRNDGSHPKRVFLPSGTGLALKIMHPGVVCLMLADLKAMYWFSVIASFLLPSIRFLSPKQSLTEFQALLLSQLDFKREADNLNQFRYNFRCNDNIVFPTPLQQLTSQHILCETFEYGSRIVTATENVGGCDVSTYLGRVVTTAFLKMLFVDNFIHADLHPGNLLYRLRGGDGSLSMGDEDDDSSTSLTPNNEDKKSKNLQQIKEGKSTTSPKKSQRGFISRFFDRWELVILDAGLTSTLTPLDREHIVGLFGSILTTDGKMGADLLLDRAIQLESIEEKKMSKSTRTVANSILTDLDEKSKVEARGILFARDLQVVMEGFRPLSMTLGDSNITEVIAKVLTTMRTHAVRLDAGMVSVLITFALSDSLGRMMAPELNFFRESVPFVMRCLDGDELRNLGGALAHLYYGTPSSSSSSSSPSFLSSSTGPMD